MNLNLHGSIELNLVVCNKKAPLNDNRFCTNTYKILSCNEEMVVLRTRLKFAKLNRKLSDSKKNLCDSNKLRFNNFNMQHVDVPIFL